ncbi:MAG: energy transducer TonB [Desulfomonilia bacterium]|jgi:TonB family protein|uniref:Gram-negative bacterial tonB protein n=1 Tax=anaerobic digester metagenome TaxID=1263854 RepID=A0A485M4C1_9ZZZZ|nr:energy transducer TonB [Pseudomonadota bacterium]HON38190.1 energy transducer TonB [Deltaproteobacteria bacterium]HRS56461.1 energy transducer TonB [Desulfomonilia bacterium]HPD22044.1 energy transducer TonB [Deltaproteobacteria bacterium]HPW69505.1 energy transducer TonB [Deltaproteobacteria bacterium]
MTTRLFVCLVVSFLIHAAVLVQPWNFIVIAGDRQPSMSIPVRLVDGVRSEDLIREIEKIPEEIEEINEGISFETEGEVSADYLDLLKAKIFDAWEYPEDAIASGADGAVRVRFVLDALGSVTEIGILSGSGHASLDSAALDAVLKAGPFGPFTEDLAGETLTITGSFCYVLD